MKITLIAIHTERSPQAVPLACAFLKEALLAEVRLKDRVEVEIAEFFLDDPVDRCAETVAQGSPDLIAFSVYVWSREHAVAIAGALRSRLPAAVICAGGAEPTADPAGLLDSGMFHFLVRGEGEGPFLQSVRLLIEGRLPKGVPGVVLTGEAPGPLPPPAKDQQLEAVYRQYVDARRACNLPVDNVTREKLAEAINRQKPALMDKYRCKDVDFIVVIEGGKPSLKARPKNS